MQTHTKTESLEEAGYFTVPDAHLYTVLHRVEDPVGRVLLVGPFASERHFSYPSWVRWARYLAARRIEVLRYDYRGIGESTGNFEEMSFDDWSEDLALLSDWFASRSPGVPLLLHGMELGAILAGRSFHDGTGDALLLWAPPVNANQALRSTLLRWAGLEQLHESRANRKTASEYIRQLESGSSIEVQGYQWTSTLWRESFDFDLPSTVRSKNAACAAFQRPVRTVRFGKDDASLVMPYTRYGETKDLTGLYSEGFEWLAGTLGPPAGGHDANVD
jgi:hypothetical protein